MKLFVWIVTVIWTVTVIGFPFSGLLSVEHPTHLNEWGDYLAGAFSPLAFLWLIMGYLQQGKELQQNTEALNLQAQELQNSVNEQRNSIIEQKNSVKQQEAQVKLLEKQLAKNLEWQLVQMNQREPSLEIESLGNNEIIIHNLGGEIKILKLVKPKNIMVNDGNSLKLEEKIKLKIAESYVDVTDLDFLYVNYLNKRYKIAFKLVDGVYKFNGVRLEEG